MVSWTEVKDSMQTAVNMVQGNPILDTFARGAIESIPGAGNILIKFYDKYAETNAEEATIDISNALKTMNKMNEEMFTDFCKRLQNNSEQVLENKTYLKQLISDTSKILEKLDTANKKLEGVETKLESIEEKLSELYTEGQKQLEAAKITESMFLKIEQRDREITLLRKQLSEQGKNSFNVNYYFKQSQAYYYAKKYEKSIEIADAILLEKPNHTSSLNLKGLSLLGMGKTKSARPYFEKALETNPEDFMIAYNLGTVFQDLKKHELAADYFIKALQKRPMTKGYIRLAESLIILNKKDQAKEHLRKGLSFHPKSAELQAMLEKASTK